MADLGVSVRFVQDSDDVRANVTLELPVSFSLSAFLGPFFPFARQRSRPEVVEALSEKSNIKLKEEKIFKEAFNQRDVVQDAHPWRIFGGARDLHIL